MTSPRSGPLLVAVLLASLVAGVSAEDWPQILGPTRDGVYRGTTRLAASFPENGPPTVWTKKVGEGFAGPAVAAGRVFLFHRIGRDEIVEALDAETGATIWLHRSPTAYRDDFGFDEGPRAVPVIAGGRVHTYGAEGVLTALDQATGKVIWSVDVMERFDVPKGYFGAAGSPLVEGSRIILNAGGQAGDTGIIALSAATGTVLWTATTHEASYSSPAIATIGGARTAVFLTREGVVGLDSASGRVRFQQRWRARFAASVNAATPLVIGNLIFVSASYETGAAAYRVTGDTLAPLWSSDDALSNHYATSVYRDGTLYGFHGRQEFGQSFRAVDLETGTVRWSAERFGAGTVMLVGDRLLIVTEGGDLVLAPASPKAFTPSVRRTLLPATVRAYPALADGILYVRNEGTLTAFDLR